MVWVVLREEGTRMKRRISALGIVLLSVSSLASGQIVERNVIYGMHSGLGLLMDVYRPARSNGIAIVAILRKWVVFADAL